MMYTSEQFVLFINLQITKLDSIQVEDALRVSKDESIQSKDLEHLKGGDQGTAALLDHMTNWKIRRME